MKVDTGKLLPCYKKYMQFDVEHPSIRKVFIANMEEKMNPSGPLS
ncbi:MAG: hypothetical protein WKF89_19100 [Chitinophagaceae bacterium]